MPIINLLELANSHKTSTSPLTSVYIFLIPILILLQLVIIFVFFLNKTFSVFTAQQICYTDLTILSGSLHNAFTTDGATSLRITPISQRARVSL
jgi:hypothetical protein